MKSVFSLSPNIDEPYLTQVFAFILKSDNQFCSFLVSNIFGLKSTGEILDIIPESSADSGRPDIVIRCENERIAVENKIDAAFTINQIERYKTEFRYVFLIYRYLSEPAQANYATDSFTWYKIYSATKSYIQKLSDSYNVINKYLLKQFIAFLEETNMGAEKVSWEILDGTRSLFNLYTQILEALERLKGRKQIGKYKMGGTGV